MNKRGQLIGQPLIYIFALIVAALILFFGIQQTLKILETSNYIKIIDFKDKLDSQVKTFYSLDPGSSSPQPYKLSLPSKITQICIYSSNKDQTDFTNEELNKYLSVRNSNIFFLPLDSFKNKQLDFTIEHLEAPDEQNPICFRNNQEYNLKTTSTAVQIIR